MSSELELEDKRAEFIADYVLKSLKLKQDKWMKMWNVEANKMLVVDFFEKPELQELYVLNTAAGALVAQYDQPTSIKNKACYFLKKQREVVSKDAPLNKTLLYGDVSYSPLEQFSAFVDEVMLPVLANNKNQESWPEVVSKDVVKHTHKLKHQTDVIVGQSKGKTFLPMPVGSEKVIKSKGDANGVNMSIVHALESVVINWAHQIDQILKKNSADALLSDQNPTPYVELEFWKTRVSNLEYIYEQLTASNVRKMAELLERIDSTYFPPFKDIFRSVVASLKEAQDINLHLSPIRNILEDFEQAEFDESKTRIDPIYHVVCLIWVTSKYYRSPEKIVVLLQEICNLVIESCRNFLDPMEIFKGELEEVLEKIEKALGILHYFRASYEKFREKIPEYFQNRKNVSENDTEQLLWEFSPDLVFCRMDAFIHRVELVQETMNISIEFLKLEKVEIGGVKGKGLSQQVVAMFEEFSAIFKIFSDQSYDCLDIRPRKPGESEPQFMLDYQNFVAHVEDMDRRLAAIVCTAFDDCNGTESIFKLIDIFGAILERPLIKNEFDQKYPRLIEKIDLEMNTAKEIYDEHMRQFEAKVESQPGVYRNMPMMTGELRWSKDLFRRIDTPISQIKSIREEDHPECYRACQSDEFSVVQLKYDQLKELLTNYDVKVYNEWTSGVNEICSFNIQQALLTRSKDVSGVPLISVNFDPKLVAVLREVRYLEIRHREETAATSDTDTSVPESAGEIYQKNETLRKFINNLDLMVEWYNYVRKNITHVDSFLIQGQLAEIDQQLEQGESTLSWSSEDAETYIESTRDMIKDLHNRVVKTKENADQIAKLMSTWSKSPLFERKEGKYETLLNLDDRKDRLQKRYAEIEEVGNKIHKLLAENLELFKANATDKYWKDYVKEIDERVVEGFNMTIKCSLQYILDQSEAQSDTDPLFKAAMDLQTDDVIFEPALDNDISDNLLDLIDGLNTDIFKQASFIKRLAEHTKKPDYQQDMEKADDLCALRDEIQSRVRTVMEKGRDYRANFDEYNYLYQSDREEFKQHFLRYGRELNADDMLDGGGRSGGAGDDELGEDGQLEERPPKLEQFKELINKFEKLHDEVEKIESTQRFDYWFLVDSRRFKQAMLNTIKKWSFMFKQHLIDHVTTSLQELSTFIRQTDSGLSKELNEGDYDGLVNVMGHLGEIKDRQSEYDTMFEPLKQTIDLLKTYNQEMPDEVHQQLEELPEKWNNTKKIAITVKQTVAPFQNQEVANIRKKCATFDVAQFNFREKFRKIKPFLYDCLEHYADLDENHIELSGMEKEMTDLIDSATLFEVNLPEFKQLKQCRKELKLLKQLWDYVNVVRYSLDDWKTTKWREINVEQMDMDCKTFAKNIRALDKEMRAWDVYTGVEDAVKNMISSLRAVSELQNPSIRDRHWAQLMAATGVKFNMNNETTLEDLLSLNLHNFEDDVRGIVDKAIKEMSMEKVLKELNGTWSQMEFEHDKHPRTGITMLKASEELIETLEENQVQLQNMMTSKYIAHFLEEVSNWQKKLSNADQVIQIWFEVQRTWSHLESIFIGSDDIRNQLPEDSERFDGIDTDFKALVHEVEESTNVIKSTNRPNLYERLEAIQNQLVLCEKALAEYLETKRLAFPRFYFVSAADLLDILSNGNNPSSVTKHLTKLFDSMSDLTFESDTSKIATKMSAKDGEIVDLAEKCDLEGQVENWLNRLLDEMRNTMCKWLADAVVTGEEKSRDQAIFENPAQVALCASQITWSTEVNMAFARLEEGYENAMKDLNKKQINQLNQLITLLIGKLTSQERQKIMTICTIDVHNRDVVAKLIQLKVDNGQEFNWLCQLRHRWDDTEKDCFINICDAQFRYAHEFLGNTPRLVITPLTDRCYITLTQSLHLTMSGAPAGPAGTGKTETTKDLGRALGIMVYVFNCSEQMDYKSIGNIYKGLAQSGSWGCFDEFNRISVEVLSVVAVQVKAIQDAIKDKKKRFDFLGEDINLDSAVGIFITMNPGYAGRTELPENLKALFRACAMVVPDFELICEIMLVAEGFIDARLLARKFITLYQLCKELLSKQDHYDWGLRAIKSVLVVAGALKRSDPDRPEDQVLMRALRDFNIPKIVSDDLPIFMGLIGDLFPALDVPRKRDMEFEKKVKQATLDLRLQPEDNFILKVVQLQELFEVRHSVFVLGNAGTGKSMVWKTLNKTYANEKRKPMAVDLNPKAVTNDELFGIINPSTREWKDGLFSVIMRDLSVLTSDGPKWIVLDGDIDPMWIESLNTVMDDNKVLTLASNERIPLTPSMRLLFEISHLKTATPATVSRAGILYINPGDLGWNPFVNSWIATREIQSEQANLTILFDKYVPACLDALKFRFKKITPIVEIAHVQMLCYLLEVLLTEENTPLDCPKEWYEIYFVFCAVWAFGGAMFQDQLVDHRVEFTKWWTTEFKTVKFPTQGTVFDYFIDQDTKKFEMWNKRVDKFELDLEQPLQAVLVPTTETTRIRYFLDLLVERKRPVMLVGNAGTGKTVLLQDKLNALNDDNMITNVPFNFYTTSEMLQRILEKPLEKKAGRNYGPPGNKKLIYFIDDMNMPEVDTYFTVQPHTLIRQHLDYSHWYDRTKLSLKDVHNTQYVACMNPTAGSFTITPRLQRHFCVFALSFPGVDALRTIYSSILSQHLQMGSFPGNVQKVVPQLTELALTFHSKVTTVFLPTAIKFHYVFNLRDLSNIFQGILFSSAECVKQPVDLVRLYMHEAERVYGDKMVDDADIETFQKHIMDVTKKSFEDMDEGLLAAKPNLYSHFAQGIGEPKYMPVDKFEDLNKIMVEALDNYNELNAAMNLVLFEDAINHVLRINRILESPRGNALLVGVGGSGKQSLSRLAAFISSLEVFQITLRKGYGIADLRADLSQLYMKAGVKGLGIVFLLTDAQVADEKFLVLVNDLLASGEIPDLFPDDEVENIIGAVRNEVKSSGQIDSRENCWAFFIERVRRLLKVVLCFSPVGNALRVRARKFPAVVNCTSIDWFHEWPQEALMSVSRRFLQEVELLPEDLRESTARFMSFVHKSVNETSIAYLTNERRYNYTTPKSFLEQIKLYGNMLRKKHSELIAKMNRLENGLQKLESTAQQVDDLKAKLKAQEIELEGKNEEANKLLTIVGAETEKVSGEKEFAGTSKQTCALSLLLNLLLRYTRVLKKFEKK